MNTHFFLIDDDDDEHEIFQEAISIVNDSFKCTYSSSGKNALQILNSVNPDFIFIDINMPGMTGFDILTKIREKENHKDTFVVMYSNGIDRATNLYAKKIGANICIRKTSTVNELATVIDNLVKSRSGSTNISN